MKKVVKKPAEVKPVEPPDEFKGIIMIPTWAWNWQHKGTDRVLK